MTRASLVLALLTALALPATAAAAEPPPGAAISSNLEYVGLVPNTRQVVDGNFDTVRGKKVMVVTGRFGIRTYDVTDPEQPRALDTLQPDRILGPNGLWEDEDVDVDRRRKLVIVSLDPRHDDVDQQSCPGVGTSSAKTRNPGCRSGITLLSYKDPSHLEQVGEFVDIPAGHTSTCIDGCKFVWTGGPARRDDQGALGPFTPGGRGDGRPIWVTDLRDPHHPKVFPDPIDVGRNDGLTDYSHDVQVDANGIAWSSGRGGILGYATSGKHPDPRDGGRVRRATPWNPVLVAGGGVSDTADPAMFMHNSTRPTTDAVGAPGVKTGDVLIGTEEQFNDRCDNDGRVTFSDLSTSYGGAAASSTPEAPYRMRSIATWHPIKDGAEGVDPSNTNCSAHYFDLQQGALATTWYGQGTRILDVSDASKPRQVAYYRVTGTDPQANPGTTAFSVKWRGDLLYVYDISRGIEILRLKGGTARAASMRTVRAPAATPDPTVPQPVGSAPFICPLFR